MGSLAGILIFGFGIGFVIMRVVRTARTKVGGYEDRYLESTSDQLDSLFVFITPEGLLHLSMTAGSVGCVLGALLGISFGLVGLLVCIGLLGGIGFSVPKLAITIMVHVRRTRFLKQLPEALDVLCKGLKAGLSVMQGFQLVAREMPTPVSQEFGLLVKDVQLGRSTSEAMEMLYRRMPLKEVQLIVLVVTLSRRLGGDLTEALTAVSQTVRNRFNVERKVKALTGEARIQGVVVCLLPFFLFAVFLVINPEMMQPLMESFAGVLVLGVVVVLELMGAAMMWKLSKIKY